MKDPVALEMARLDRLAKRLDAKFRLPLTNFRFGWDSIIGLIPGVGDAAVAAPSAYMIYRGRQLGARKRALARMGVNTGLDFVIGSIPLVGDILDFGFKSNLKNIDILRSELTRLHQGASPNPD